MPACPMLSLKFSRKGKRRDLWISCLKTMNFTIAAASTMARSVASNSGDILAAVLLSLGGFLLVLGLISLLSLVAQVLLYRKLGLKGWEVFSTDFIY